jgi:hypothetical protein
MPPRGKRENKRGNQFVQLEDVFNRISSDKVWAMDMEVQLAVTVLENPLVVVSDSYPNFEVLDVRDGEYVMNHYFLCNIHEKHFSVLVPLTPNDNYPSFPPFESSIVKGFFFCIVSILLHHSQKTRETLQKLQLNG